MKFRKLGYISEVSDIKTKDNRHIKKGLLYRSSYFVRLKENEIEEILKEFHLTDVIDLRTAEEINFYPEEHLFKGKVNYHNLPLVTEAINPATNKENRLRILDNIVKKKGGTKGHILTLYDGILFSDLAVSSYKEIFKIFLSNNGDKVIDIHCSQGKDRTGMTFYLLLSALGVEEKRIKRFYLEFNRRSFFNRIIYFIGMVFGFGFKKAIALNMILTARSSYFNYVIKEIKNKYQSVNKYLSDVIGLKEKDLEKLKNIYLE